MTIDDETPREQSAETAVADEVTEPDAASAAQHGYLGFTLRELIIVGVWLLAFVVSFFPLYWGSQPSIWGLGLQWIVPIGVPTVAVFLLVLRRLSPQGIRRVGSLSIDQFASVAFTVALAYWIPVLWDSVAAMIAHGRGSSWVFWVESVLMLVLVAATVFAPLIPGLREDFEGRPESPAHRAANPIRPVVAHPRPVAVAPVFAEAENAEQSGEEWLETPVGEDDDAAGGEVDEQTNDRSTTDDRPTTSDAVPQPFWVLAPTERDVVDELGLAVFGIGPTAWALVIDERDGAYVVRHEDGRTGLLHEIDDLTKG